MGILGSARGMSKVEGEFEKWKRDLGTAKGNFGKCMGNLGSGMGIRKVHGECWKFKGDVGSARGILLTGFGDCGCYLIL